MDRKGKQNLYLSLLSAALIVLLIAVGTFRRLDKWIQDRLFQRPQAASTEIIIVGMDEKSLAELGPYSSWDRHVVASALDALASDPDHMPAVVAIDTLYAGETSEEADSHLVQAASRLPHVVTASVADYGMAYTTEGISISAQMTITAYEEPFAALRAVTAQGHINAMYDQDGIMRHAILYEDIPESTAPEAGRVYSMAYETAKAYLSSRGESMEVPPTDARGHFSIPYSAEPGGYWDGISLSGLIAGEYDPALFSGRIVLIGPYAIGLQDAYFTPISPSKQMYGVELQANVIQSLIDRRFVTELPDWPQVLLLALLSLAAMYLYLHLRVSTAGVLAFVLAVAGMVVPYFLYSAGYITHPLWIPLAAAALFVVSVIRHYVIQAIERQRVTQTFARYVAPEIVQEILKEGTEELHLGGTLRHIAVLFVDIRGFTSMSERLDPEKVVWILNQYLTMTSECVARNHGTLDKYVGDATMAFWGAPLPLEDPVYFAAKTAMEIVEGAHTLSEKLMHEIQEELHVGVGVNFGPAVVGNMGSARRMDYTAIGDTVNTASRLEANAPSGKVYISRAVADALGERARCTSLHDTVRLKGKAAGFEVLTLDALV